MPQAHTKHFGSMDYDEAAVLTFPAGLPAFEQLTRFLMIEHPSASPLVFLQSLDDVGVCFAALPMLAVDPDYQLCLTPDDLEILGFASDEQIPAGNSIGCFAIVSVPGSGIATANLLAPVVVNLAARRAAQSVRLDARYSHQHLIVPASAREGVCS